MDRVWFHGTGADFDDFASDSLGRGVDQLGSGFYFTSERSTASGYASQAAEGGRVLMVRLEISNPLPEEMEFGRAAIREMLLASPNFERAIEDFGEIALEGREKVIRRAVDIYVMADEGGECPVGLLNTISNDFWQGEEAAFLAAVRDATGHDGLFRTVTNEGEVHAVAWFPEQVVPVNGWVHPAPRDEPDAPGM